MTLTPRANRVQPTFEGRVLPNPDEPAFDLGPPVRHRNAPRSAAPAQDRGLRRGWCDKVYATAGYEQSIAALSRVSLTSDGVFGEDGGVHQLGTVTGDVASGMSVLLAVPVG
jgi:hypothetical protein